MTIEERARVCQQRSESDPVQDRAHAYGYIARHLEDRRQITLVQLVGDLELWIGSYQRSAQQSRAEGSRLGALIRAPGCCVPGSVSVGEGRKKRGGTRDER